MPAGVYAMFSNIPWVDPIDAGPDTIYPTFAGINEHCQAEHKCLKARKSFHKIRIIKIALKNLVYAAIKPIYWASIRDTILGLTHFCILATFK